MELYEREYFIARIFSGYLRHKVNKDLAIRIYAPNMEQTYEAQEIFKEARQEARKNEVMTADEVLETMIELGVWTDIDEELIEKLPKDLDNFKAELYNSRHKLSQVGKIRKYIEKAKKEYLKIMTKRHEYDHVTSEGYAVFCRWHWLVEQCTFYENGDPYDWKHLDSSQVLKFYRKQDIYEEIYRELARTDPFRTTWSLGGSFQGVFGISTSSATVEQKTISMYSRMYDNVQESMETPASEVIEDDDMLDGWFVVQKRKRDEEKKKSGADDIGHSGAQEVYLMADGKEEIEKIQDLNTLQGKMVAKQRHRVVEDKGKVKHEDLPDVKRDIQMQSSQMQAQKKG